MNPDLSLPHRKNLRIPEFDYSQPGAYYVTIVTQNRKTLFGQIVDGDMVLNEIGKMVKEIVEGVPRHYQNIHVEVSVIIPNHVHILFLITDVVAGPRACQSDQSNNGQPQGVDPTKARLSFVVAGPRACHMDQRKSGQPQGVDPTKEQLSLPDIVHRIKSLTTHRYMLGVRDKGWPRFDKRLWQRNYYEHIIRNERDYQAIYEYIFANPFNWEKDEEFFLS